jgi:hypothetical protein
MIITSDVKRSTKMLDNSVLIRELLDFSNPDSFYFLQILKRRKDNPDLDRDCIVLGDYYIHSLENFDRLVKDLLPFCEKENARAYIRLNRRDTKKLAFQVLKRVADYISSGNYKAVKSAYASCAGEFFSDEDKKWIVDVDWKDWSDRAEVDVKLLPLLEELQEETGREAFTKAIPTKNGVHIITRPFDVSEFREKYPNVDVHKDNPTILFSPL